MRRAGRTDSNQQEIVKAFRQIGASVQLLSSVGKGCPDVLVGFRGRNVLVEVKRPKLSPSQHLTKDQIDWHANWGGQVCVAESISDAVEKVIAAAI